MLLAFFFYCSSNMCGSGYLFWSEEMGIFLIFFWGGGLLLRRKQISAAATSNPEKKCRSTFKINHSPINNTRDHKTKARKPPVHWVRALSVKSAWRQQTREVKR